MHLKVFLKLKKNLKTLSSGQIYKKLKKNKKPTRLVFFLKTRVFSNPAARVKLSPLPATEVSLGEEEDEDAARLQFKAFMHREQFKAGLRIRISIGSGFNRVSGSGSRRAKMTHKSRKFF
jgi:hypothetical protein